MNNIESEQAQTIAEIQTLLETKPLPEWSGTEIDSALRLACSGIRVHGSLFIYEELSIRVDSQAQKIERTENQLHRMKVASILRKDIISAMERDAEILKTENEAQAQKIVHQQAELSVTKTMLNDMNEIYAEQAKEIERLKQILHEAEQS